MRVEKLEGIELRCQDCMEYMRGLQDGVFDLAIVDPPYGMGNSRCNKSRHSGNGKLRNRVLNMNAGAFEKWDIAPSKEYFDELFRVSKHQIIWGGNYFDLPPTRGIVCWDKCQPWENFSQWEEVFYWVKRLNVAEKADWLYREQNLFPTKEELIKSL